ncbi:MAG: 4'-phosphopantetheinyl transferase superfamily protein [Ferruginibacter sp.]|nr:4'-phosphopantetheinyl transferase superfamily protein [Ferruginibacter sp.]
MPIVYQQNINATTFLGVWNIRETEAFFLAKVSLQRDITHIHKRLQHLAGRYLLKELVPAFPAELIRIADTRKPFLENEAYHFSISHCGDFAAVIVSSDHRVGTDIELATDKVDKVKHKFLSADELSIIKRLATAPHGPGFELLLTAAWCIKESLFKWYGSGEVNFKDHLHISELTLEVGGGVAECVFLKNGMILLQVRFIFFEGNCVSWVLTSVS